MPGGKIVKGTRVKGTRVAISGDNLGFHCMGLFFV